jgi:hypothetical protein
MAQPKYTLYKYVKLSGGKWRYLSYAKIPSGSDLTEPLALIRCASFSIRTGKETEKPFSNWMSLCHPDAPCLHPFPKQPAP